MPLYSSIPKGKTWRKFLTENANKPNAGVATLEAALRCMRRDHDNYATFYECANDASAPPPNTQTQEATC